MDTDLDSYIKDKGIKFRAGGRGRGRGGGEGGGGGGGGGSGGGGGMGQNRRGGSGSYNDDNIGSSFSRGFDRPATGLVTKRTQSMTSGMDMGGGGSGTLHISNLNVAVTNQDINELFGEFGNIRRFAVHFDQSGRSLGTAEVHYANAQSAVRAMNKYNGVPLDGMPMRLEISGNMPRASESSFGGGWRPMGGGGGRQFGSRNGIPSLERAKEGTRGRDRDGGGGGGGGRGGGDRDGGGRGRGGGGGGRGGNKRPPPPSKEELDAELDTLVKSE